MVDNNGSTFERAGSYSMFSHSRKPPLHNHEKKRSMSITPRTDEDLNARSPLSTLSNVCKYLIQILLNRSVITYVFPQNGCYGFLKGDSYII